MMFRKRQKETPKGQASPVDPVLHEAADADGPDLEAGQKPSPLSAALNAPINSKEKVPFAMKTSGTAYRPQQAPEPEERANLLVGSGLKLEGSINSCDRMEVQGHVDAKIEARELVVARGGQVVGTVTAQSATIEGQFNGTLEVTECIHIKKTGSISGTVKYGQLEVEKGGQIRGDIQQIDDTPRVKPLEGHPDKPGKEPDRGESGEKPPQSSTPIAVSAN